MLDALDALKMKYSVHMVKVGKCALIALMNKMWTLRVELTKNTSHCKSRDFLRKRRLKTSYDYIDRQSSSEVCLCRWLKS